MCGPAIPIFSWEFLSLFELGLSSPRGPCYWLCPSTVFLIFSASTDLQKSGSFSAWSCSFAKFLLRIAIQTWHLCWTNGFSLFCRLPWTSTHFSKCEMLPLLCWFLSLRQPLSLLVCPLYYLDIWTILILLSSHKKTRVLQTEHFTFKV